MRRRMLTPWSRASSHDLRVCPVSASIDRLPVRVCPWCVRVGVARCNSQLVLHALYAFHNCHYLFGARFLGRTRDSSTQCYDSIIDVHIDRRIAQVVCCRQVKACFHPEPAVVYTACRLSGPTHVPHAGIFLCRAHTLHEWARDGLYWCWR